MYFISIGLTLYRYFSLYRENGCSLDYGYAANNKLSFPLRALSLKQRVRRRKSCRFLITLTVVPDHSPSHRCWNGSRGAKPDVPLKKYVVKSDSEPYLFGMFYGYRCNSYCELN